MREHNPMTQVMEASEAWQQWSQVLDKVFHQETRIIVEKSGIPVAALISAEDLNRFIQLEAERAERFKILDEIGAQFKDASPEEIEREVSKAITSVRAQS